MLQCSILGLMSVFSGCNSDVFIDEFLTDSPVVSLSENETDVVVRFETDNWGIINIDNLEEGLSVSVTDLEGKNGKSLPFGEGETGIVHCKNTFLDFQVEKRNSRELHLIAGENLYDQPFDVGVRVGNIYDEKVIRVSFSPTRKYQVDSIAYDWNQLKFFNNLMEMVDEVKVNTLQNNRSVTLYFYPFQDAMRRVEFGMLGNDWNIWTGDFQKLLGDSLLQVEIPDIVNGVPGLYGTKVTFSQEEQLLDVGLDKNLKVAKTVESGRKVRIEVFNVMEEYWIPYKAYLSNSFTGKKMTISGTLSSIVPCDYLIIPIEIKNEDE